MDIISEIVQDIWNGIIVLCGFFWDFLIKYGSILLWSIFGIIVITVSFLANFLYPLWEKWGENLKK